GESVEELRAGFGGHGSIGVPGDLRGESSVRTPPRIRTPASVSGDSLVLEEAAERGHRTERAATHLFVLDPDSEGLLDRENQLESVDRVEPQALAEQRRIVGDLLGSHALQLQAADDQFLDATRETRRF